MTPRNLSVVVMVALALALLLSPLMAAEEYAASLSASKSAFRADPGDSISVDVYLSNDGTHNDTYLLESKAVGINLADGENASAELWQATLSKHRVALDAGASETLELTIEVPDDARTGHTAGVGVVAVSEGNTSVTTEVIVSVLVLDPSELPAPGLALAAAVLLIAAVRRTR